MQKKVIALAVAGLVSGAAFAQSNVTVYGIADLYYAYSNGDQLNFSGINPGGLSGNRLGFKGEEALGNGLKAIFTFEFGSLGTDRNTGIQGQRQSFVGLASDAAGSFTFGRQYAPSFLYLGATSSNEITIVNPSNYFNPAFATLNTGGGSRWNNSVAWSSPVWSGLDMRAIYSFGEVQRNSTLTTPASDVTDAGKFGFGVRYANGPIYATAIWQQVLEDDSTLAKEKNQAWALGGSYDFKVVKLFAHYVEEKFTNGGTVVGGKNIVNVLGLNTDAKKKNWTVGLSVPVGAIGSVNAEYSDYKVSEANSVKAKGFGVGYNHFFSKRTTGYVNVSYIDNKDGAAFGGQAGDGNGSANFAGSIAGTGDSTNLIATPGESNTNFGIGIRHVF